MSRWSDEQFERFIGKLLALGVFFSAFIVLVGAAIFLARHGESSTNYRVFRGEPESLKSIRGIVQYAFELQGRGIIQSGLVLLIATPVARVAFSIIGFALQRDRMYVLFTVTVLLILLFSLFSSFAAA